MTWLWIKARHYPKVAGAVLLLALILVGCVLIRIFGGRGHPAIADNGVLTRAILNAKDTIAQANAQAAVETTVARTKDAAVQTELKTVLAIDDGEERRKQLAALGNRLRKED